MNSKDIKDLLKPLILDILQNAGTRMTIVAVAREIWTAHEATLRADERLFFTWQYEMRWAAQQLVEEGRVEKGRNGWTSI